MTILRNRRGYALCVVQWCLAMSKITSIKFSIHENKVLLNREAVNVEWWRWGEIWLWCVMIGTVWFMLLLNAYRCRIRLVRVGLPASPSKHTHCNYSSHNWLQCESEGSRMSHWSWYSIHLPSHDSLCLTRFLVRSNAASVHSSALYCTWGVVMYFNLCISNY